jgi:hypothetical protein
MKKTLLTVLIALSSVSNAVIHAQCTPVFFDGFESGSYTPTWTQGTAPITFAVTSTTPAPAQGTYCLSGSGANSTHLQGLVANVPTSTPSSISWYIYPTGTAAHDYVLIGDNSMAAANCISFSYVTGGNIRFVSSVTQNYAISAYNQWYFIEMRNINYVARTFDIYINNALIQTAFPFRTSTQNTVTRIHLYHFTPGSVGAWDHITLGSVPVTSFTTVNPVTCNAGTNGSSNLTVSSGVAPFTYLWSNGATTQNISGVTAGTYSVVITDAVGCLDTAYATITEPTAITASTMQTNVQCNGDSTGDAMVMPSGGTPGYAYAWSSGGSASMESNLTAGTYTCTVTDANGCTNVQTVTVTEPNVLMSAATNGGNVCPGDTALLVGTAMGGTMNYTYNWMPGSLSGSAVNDVPSSTTTYTLMVTDANGCMDSSVTTVVVNALPSVNLGADTTVCGSIMLDAGNSGATYSWSNGDSTQVITASNSGMYFVAIVDSNGCAGNDTIDILVDMMPIAGNIYHTAGADLCVGDTSSLITVGANTNVDWWVLPAAGPFYQYIGSGNPFTQQIPSPNDVGLYYFIAIANNGVCPSDTSNTISIEVRPLPAVLLGADTASCSGITLDAQNSGSTYMWSTGDTTQTIGANASGSYSVVVTDVYGCVGSDTVNVTINTPPVVTGTASSMTPCLDDANVTLTGMPAPGTWSGPGVNGNSFDPSVGTGPQVLTYVYVDSNGCTGQYLLTVSVNPCVGISEVSDATFSVYPNPNNGTFTIAFSKSMENVIVEMTDVNGRTVVAQQYDVVAGDQKQIDLNGEASGIYLLRVTFANETVTYRIVVQQ